MVFLEVSLMNFILGMDIQGDQMDGESGVTGSIFDELHSWDIQAYQMVGESAVT